MPPKIYVDGQEGTTGLRIHERLSGRSDLELLKIDPDQRKNLDARRALLNAADIVFLCLPDAASREAVSLIANPATRVLDASTAFRTDPAWVYGLPELSAAQRGKVAAATRVAVPGCHASAFLLAVAPLVSPAILPPSTPLTCVSLTGYSGGGKKMIAQYEAPDAPPALRAPRPYALKLNHKHLPEMRYIAGLDTAPVFMPVVANIHSGLAATILLPAGLLPGRPTPQSLHALLSAHYAKETFVRVMPFDADANLDEGFLDITACNNTNRADIFVFGHDDQIALVTRLDNLGKGASGAAIQCMNLMLGLDETLGLPTA